MRRSPAWVTGEGQPYLPWLAIVASQTTGALLTFDMSRERTDSAAIVRLVGRAMLATGVRPEQLNVVDSALGAPLVAAFAGLDVAVDTTEESLPAIDHAIASLAESMTPPEAVAPLSAVPGITTAIGRAFYAAAAAFHRDRPWRRLPSDAAINVHVPAADGGEGRLVHAVVMGHVGMVQGLAVYGDDVALAVARSGDHDQAARSTGLSVMFGEAFEIPAVDYDWIERSGFEVAGPERGRALAAARAASKGPLGGWHDVTAGGDVARGRDVFFGKTEVSCVRCHKAEGKGGDVGPLLDGVGGRRDGHHLLESIVHPDAKVEDAFRTTVIVTDDGRTVAGIVTGEDAHALTLRTADGAIVTVPIASIDERTGGPSGMPADLAGKLTRRELRDLLAWLAQLK